MATDPGAIKYFLEKKLPRLPDWKVIDKETIQEHVEEAIGRRIRRQKGPPLYDHQLRALAMALSYKQSLLFLGMRTGKTRISLEWAAHLRKAGLWTKGKGLIIVPSPTLLDVWEDQIEEYCNLSVHVVRTTRDDDFIDAVEGNHDLIVVAWSTLKEVLTFKRPETKYRKVVLKPNGEPKMVLKTDIETCRILAQSISLAIVDEIHMCKSTKSLNFELGQLLLENAEYRMGLTGTPFGRYPLDVWPQAFLIDEGKTLGYNQHFFTECFATKKKSFWGGPYAMEVKFDKAKLPILQRKLDTISLAYKLEELRDIKEVHKISRPVLTAAQGKEYTRIVQDNIEHIMTHGQDEDFKPKSLFTKLRQISSGHIPFVDGEGDKQINTLPIHAKLLWLRAQIDAGLADTRFVFYYEFTPSGQQIMSELTKNKIKAGWVYGQSTKNSEHIRDFQQGKLQGLVINSKSGNVGIDLWPADYMCFYECSVSPIIRAQAEKRPFGPKRGDRPVYIEDLIVSKVEDRVYGFVKEGKKLLSETIYTKQGILDWLA